MADDDDRETERQEYLFGQLKLTMKDERTRTKVFNRLCGVPLPANQVKMMMDAVDQFLHPKAKAAE